MTLALALGEEHWPVGSPDQLHAFFSTVSYHLEPGGWGSRFPALMCQLYDGILPVSSVETALSELLLARRELGCLPASRIVWDIDAPAAEAPWGGGDVPDLSHAFSTPDGRDLFDVVAAALMRLRVQPAGELRISLAA